MSADLHLPVRFRSQASLWLLIFGSVALGAIDPSPLFAADRNPDATGTKATQAESDSSSDQKPVATQRESVVVEAPLPLIPSSNTISTKLPVDQVWTPFNVGAVSQPLMQEQFSLVLGDALENISGVNAQTGSGVFDFFVVRGFDSLTSGLILTDGAPEPETTYYQLYNAERVEMLKGPGGFLYGPNALAAAVNIVRKQPSLSNFGSISAAGGSFSTFQGSVDVNRASKDGTMAFRLNGLYRDTDGYRDNTDGSVGALNPAFSWRPSSSTTVNVNYEYVDSDYNPDAGMPVAALDRPQVDRETSYASPFDFSEQSIHRAQVDVEHRISDRFGIRNKTFYRQLDWNTDGTLLGFVIPGGIAPSADLVTRSLLLLDDKQDIFGNQFEATLAVATGPVRHRLLTGLEVSQYSDLYSLDVGLLPPIFLEDPVETATDLPPLLPGQSAAGDSRSRLIAPYVIDEIAFSSKVQVLVGARYDAIDFEDDVTGTSREDGKLSPMLGAVFRPNDRLSFYGNFARSFAPPSPRVAGERDPEESQEIELGVRQDLFDGKARLTLALYDLERQNIAIPDDNGFTQQAGDQRSRGFEFEATADLPSGLTGLFSYAYTDSELTSFAESVVLPTLPPTVITVDRSGNTSAFSPENLAKLWLTQKFDSGLMVGGGLRYVGSQFIAEDNDVEISGYTILDLMAAYTLGAWRLSLNLDNVTDTEYETRGFGGFSVIPGRPFSALLGVQYRF